MQFLFYLSPGQKIINLVRCWQQQWRQKRAFGVLVSMCTFAASVRRRLFCMLGTRWQHWPLGDRRSNKDVWLLQNPSAGIFLLSFTPFSRLTTHLILFSKEYTGTRGNPLLPITSTVIAFSHSWQIIRRVLGIHRSHSLSILLTCEMEVIFLFFFY